MKTDSQGIYIYIEECHAGAPRHSGLQDPWQESGDQGGVRVRMEFSQEG